MIDRAQIIVRGGKGGDGCISFRREKFAPYGGPDGGNGGRGGDVVLKADPSVSDLRRYKLKGKYRAEDGRHGEGNNRHGKNGAELELGVPPGTIIKFTTPEGEVTVIDLEAPGQKVVVARGGRGGLGNAHYTTSTHQAPRIAQTGESGEDNTLSLEMRLIADVGIIGYPNVGKSTLLAAASAAKPKIASYPFTTLEPVLGVVEVGKDSFTLAEIPGLIEGAHLGRGLGHEFLRHVMRTKMLIHLVDAGSASPMEDLIHVNAELGLYDPLLAQKPQVVALNKIDLPETEARLAETMSVFASVNIVPVAVSAATGKGVSELMARAAAMLRQIAADRKVPEVQPAVFRPKPRPAVSVRKEGDTFVVLSSDLGRIVTRGGLTGAEVRWQLNRQLTRMGVNKALEKAGVKPGDKVRCGNLEWEW